MGQEQSALSTCDRRHTRGATRAPPPRPHRESPPRDHYAPPTPPKPSHKRCSHSRHSSQQNLDSASHKTKSSTLKDGGSVSSGYTSSKTECSISSDTRPKSQIYTNVHYKDINNNDIYKPLKIGKSKLHKLKILNADKDTAIYLEKHLSIKSYLQQEDETNKKKVGPQLPEPLPKKSGIRNYTPKILTEKNPQKDLEHWI